MRRARVATQRTHSADTAHVGHVVYLSEGAAPAAAATDAAPSPAPRSARSESLVLVDQLWMTAYARLRGGSAAHARHTLTDAFGENGRAGAFLSGFALRLPHQTFHVVTKMFHEQEVFRTTTRRRFAASDIVGFAVVLPLRDYVRGRPSGVAPEDVWVCEARYSDHSRSFERLRNFARLFPEPVHRPHPALELFVDGPRKVRMLKSPHAPPAPPPPPAAAAAAATGTGGAGRPGAEPATEPSAASGEAVLDVHETDATVTPALSAAPRRSGEPRPVVVAVKPLSLGSLYTSAPVAAAAAAAAANRRAAVASTAAPVSVHTVREASLPALRSVVINQVGVVLRLSDACLLLPQLLRGLAIPPDRIRALYDLLSPLAVPSTGPGAATAAPVVEPSEPAATTEPSDDDGSEAAVKTAARQAPLPLTAGPWSAIAPPSLHRGRASTNRH
jgi:hypothetical protein